MSTPETTADLVAAPATVTPERQASVLPLVLSGPQTVGWWGMVLFLVGDLLLFAFLFTSYFYLEASTPHWPPAGVSPPDLRRPIVMTIVLLGSSIPMAWADSSIRRGHQGRLKLGLALAFVLFAIFLGLQVWEYSSKPFGLTTNIYGSLFFTITGLHGLHIVVGLLLSAYLQARAWLGHFSRHRHLAVENIALYWHFVDAIWVVIFISIYLWPFWG
jgi:heme/copper-type cytochrome/quinol oxidase subunit 3